MPSNDVRTHAWFVGLSRGSPDAFVAQLLVAARGTARVRKLRQFATSVGFGVRLAFELERAGILTGSRGVRVEPRWVHPNLRACGPCPCFHTLKISLSVARKARQPHATSTEPAKNSTLHKGARVSAKHHDADTARIRPPLQPALRGPSWKVRIGHLMSSLRQRLSELKAAARSDLRHAENSPEGKRMERNVRRAELDAGALAKTEVRAKLTLLARDR